MCGIVGIVSSKDVNQQIYDSLLLLQHRGQDSTGIATMENTIFQSNLYLKKIGNVSCETLDIKVQDKNICNIRVEELTEKFNNSISSYL